MEFNQTLMARRSLRAYEEGKTVEKAQIEEMIRFAQMAPSWKNSQTGRYYVVMSPEMLEKVKKDCLPEFTYCYGFCKNPFRFFKRRRS